MSDNKQKQAPKQIKVTNNHTGAIILPCKTEIAAGKSAKVDDCQAHGVVKQWIAKGVLKVG